jgi:hypothetical protein
MIIYMIMIIYFMFTELRLLYKLKWKYFLQFWSLIDFGIIICSWIAVGVYIWRYKESKRISRLFKQTNGYAYINLQLAAYVNDILTFVLGFCCFFGTIKLIRLGRFNRRLSLFVQTLRYAGKELVSFSLMFSIIFFSLVCLFYFLFISKIWSCSSFLNTSQMLFEMSLLKFNARELIRAAAVLGPVCFCSFIIIVVFICMSMFLSIINDSFQLARKNRINDDGIYSFMLKRFLLWTGLKKKNVLEIQEERDIQMRSEYLSAVDIFPEKVEQLFEALNRVIYQF